MEGGGGLFGVVAMKGPGPDGDDLGTDGVSTAAFVRIVPAISEMGGESKNATSRALVPCVVGWQLKHGFRFLCAPLLGKFCWPTPSPGRSGLWCPGIVPGPCPRLGVSAQPGS